MSRALLWEHHKSARRHICATPEQARPVWGYTSAGLCQELAAGKTGQVQSVGESRGRVGGQEDQGEGRAERGWTYGQAGLGKEVEAGCWILTPILISVVLAWAARSCTSHSSIGVAVAYSWIRGKYPLTHRWPTVAFYTALNTGQACQPASSRVE